MKDEIKLKDFTNDFEHLRIFFVQLTDLKLKKNKKTFRTFLNSFFINYVDFYFFYIDEYEELHVRLEITYNNGYNLLSFNCDANDISECYNLIFGTLLDAYNYDY